MNKYEKQQEKEKQLYDKKHAEDFDSTYSNDPITKHGRSSFLITDITLMNLLLTYWE